MLSAENHSLIKIDNGFSIGLYQSPKVIEKDMGELGKVAWVKNGFKKRGWKSPILFFQM